MARYPIKIFISLKNSVELSYLIKANKGTLKYELKTKTGRPVFSKAITRSSSYEIDLIQDALNGILHNAKPDLQSENLSRLVYAMMEGITIHNNSTFSLAMQENGSLEVV